MRNPDPPLTTEEAELYLRVRPRTLEAMRLRRDPNSPPFVRIGRLVRYPQSLLDKWLENNIVKY